MSTDPFARGIATIRGGLALGAAAAIMLALSPFSDVVTGPAAVAGGTFTAGVSTSVGAGAAIAAIVMIAPAAGRVLWLHLLGLVIATGVALLCALLVIVARTSSDFRTGAGLHIGGGGALLITAFWIALAGVLVALFGVRLIAVAAPPPIIPASRAGQLVTARTAPVAAALGAAGVVIVVTAGAAVAYGVLALGDIRSSGGRLSGRGLALTGLVLGSLVLSLLAAIGGIGSITASPG